MTKAERERVRRHAAVVVVGTDKPQADTEGERWAALQRWRGQAERPQRVILVRLDREPS